MILALRSGRKLNFTSGEYREKTTTFLRIARFDPFNFRLRICGHNINWGRYDAATAAAAAGYNDGCKFYN